MRREDLIMSTKKLKYGALFLVGLLVLQSCFKNDEEYWDESATIRLENTIQDYRSVLVNSEYGWVMDFYPDQTFTEGGYVYTMKFEEDGNVAVGYELADPADTRTSMYSIEGGEGPVLTFDTYNEFMHYFANPSKQNYEGRGGDYEFVLQRRSDAGDYVKTLGRKSKNHMPMYKLTMPMSDYYAAVDQTESELDNPYLFVKVGESAYTLTRDNFAKLYMTDENDAVTFPFVYTDTGMRFRDGIGVDGGKDSVFVFNEGHNLLLGVNDSNVTLDGGNFGLYLSYAGLRGSMFAFSDYPAALQSIADQIVSQCNAIVPNSPVENIGLSADNTVNGVALTIKCSGRLAHYGLDVEADPTTGQFTISLPSEPRLSTNCKRFIDSGVTAIEQMAQAICGDYTYESENKFTFDAVTLTSGDVTIFCEKISKNN